MKAAFLIVIICLCLFLTKTSLAQTEILFSSYKERIKLLVEKKDYDSIIAYAVHYSFPPPPNQTVKSLNNTYHYDDAFLVCFKNDSCFAICIAQYDSGIATSNRILIQAKPEIDKLRKSWGKVEHENFIPFVYKHKGDGKIRYDTLQAVHPMNGSLTFRSPGYYETKDFTPLVTEKTAWDYENINYTYNASLSLFTVYKIIEDLYNSLYKQFVYHK